MTLHERMDFPLLLLENSEHGDLLFTGVVASHSVVLLFLLQNLASNGQGIDIDGNRVVEHPQAGQPVGMYYGLQILGLYTAEEIANTSVPKYAGAAVGTIKYLDGNGNGILEQQADHVVIGNPHPDLMFGWTNQFTAYGFNLRAIFAGQLGGAIMDLRKEIMYNVDGNFNVHRDLLDRFRPGDDPA